MVGRGWNQHPAVPASWLAFSLVCQPVRGTQKSRTVFFWNWAQNLCFHPVGRKIRGFGIGGYSKVWNSSRFLVPGLQCEVLV